MCALHQQWIQYYWYSYTKEAYLGLVKMYTTDKAGQGAALFLYESMKSYLP